MTTYAPREWRWLIFCSPPHRPCGRALPVRSLHGVDSRLGRMTGLQPKGITMNGNRYYGVRVEGAKYGVGFGSALAIAISYTNNHSILWAIIHGILGWLYVIYAALFG
jgi:hypothetical protein